MADIFETRCVSDAFPGDPGLIRIACIGDSMVYGQGVSPNQTLSAFLTQMLNAAYPTQWVFVDNFGQSSGNLWHTWPLLKQRAKTQTFDGLVFSICQNDAELFESSTVAYKMPQVELWKPGTPQFEAARRLLKDVADTSKAYGWSTIINFYTLIDGDKPIIDVVSALCQELQLPFVDLLSYLKQQTGINTRTYIASEFDGHPSGLGHEAVARKITAEYRKASAFAGRAAVANVAEGAYKAVGALASGGVWMDMALDWAREASHAKERATRRSLAADAMQRADELAAAIKVIDAASRDWRRARAVEAALHGMPAESKFVRTDLPNFAHHIRSLRELVYLLIDPSIKTAGRSFAALFENGYFSLGDRLRAFVGLPADMMRGARARLDKALSLLEPDPLTAGLHAAVPAAVSARIDPLRSGDTMAQIRFEAEMLSDLAGQLQAACDAGLAPESSADSNWLLWAIAHYYVVNSIKYLEIMSAPLLENAPPAASIAAPWTRVDVVLEGGPDPEIKGRVCSLRVEIDYLVPQRFMLRQAHWAGVEKDRAAYRFELPVMIKGNLRVGVGIREPVRERFLKGTTRITRIEIQNVVLDQAAAKPVIWSEQDAKLAQVDFNNLVLV